LVSVGDCALRPLVNAFNGRLRLEGYNLNVSFRTQDSQDRVRLRLTCSESPCAAAPADRGELQAEDLAHRIIMGTQLLL